MNLKSFIGALITIAGVSPVLAQSGNSINPPTTPQTAPTTAAEQQNLDMVLKWWREVIEAHHTELGEKYLAEDYIQHNPNVPTGRAAFIKLFSGVPPTNPMPEHLTHPPVVEGAKGDFVWLVFEDESKDPHDPSKTYHYDTFDVLRIQNGKIQEHWDSEKRVSGAPDFVPSTAPAPSTWNTGKLSAKEQRNIGLATEEFKDTLQNGHLELADKTILPGVRKACESKFGVCVPLLAHWIAEHRSRQTSVPNAPTPCSTVEHVLPITSSAENPNNVSAE